MILPFSGLFRRFIPQLLHIIVLPLFFFCFMLIYKPLDIVEYFGNEWFAVHLTIVSCIILLCIIITRLLFYYLPIRLNIATYIFWCLMEVICFSLFVALYLWLALHRTSPYFEVVATSFKYIFLTSVIPYSILALSLRVNEYKLKFDNPEENNSQRMRFYDSRHNLKFVVNPDSLLYCCRGKLYKYLLSREQKREMLRPEEFDEVCRGNMS